MSDMSNYTFVLLEDGSLYVTAAKLTDKVHFDSGVRFGDKSLGEFLNEVFAGGSGGEGGTPDEPIVVIVTLYANGGIFSDGNEQLVLAGKTGELMTGYKDPVRESINEIDYLFTGWGTSSNSSIATTQLSTSSVFGQSDATYYAVWAENGKKVSITFYQADMINIVMTAETSVSGQLDSSLWPKNDSLEMGNRMFFFWSLDKEGRRPVTSSYHFSADTSVYPICGYKINLNLNEVNLPRYIENSEIIVGSPYCRWEYLRTNYNGILIDTLPYASCSGAHFNNWYSTNIGAGSLITKQTTFESHSTIHARWSEIYENVDITLDAPDFAEAWIEGNKLPLTISTITLDLLDYRMITDINEGRILGYADTWRRLDSGEEISGFAKYSFGEDCTIRTFVDELEPNWGPEDAVGCLSTGTASDPFDERYEIEYVYQISLPSSAIITTDNGQTYASLDLRQMEGTISWIESAISLDVGENVVPDRLAIALPQNIGILEIGSINVSYLFPYTTDFCDRFVLNLEGAERGDQKEFKLSTIVYLPPIGQDAGSYFSRLDSFYLTGINFNDFNQNQGEEIDISMIVGGNSRIEVDNDQGFFISDHFYLCTFTITSWDEMSGEVLNYHFSQKPYNPETDE